jgi:hypothetical protein
MSRNKLGPQLSRTVHLGKQVRNVSEHNFNAYPSYEVRQGAFFSILKCSSTADGTRGLRCAPSQVFLRVGGEATSYLFFIVSLRLLIMPRIWADEYGLKPCYSRVSVAVKGGGEGGAAAT